MPLRSADWPEVRARCRSSPTLCEREPPAEPRRIRPLQDGFLNTVLACNGRTPDGDTAAPRHQLSRFECRVLPRARTKAQTPWHFGAERPLAHRRRPDPCARGTGGSPLNPGPGRPTTGSPSYGPCSSTSTSGGDGQGSIRGLGPLDVGGSCSIRSCREGLGLNPFLLVRRPHRPYLRGARFQGVVPEPRIVATTALELLVEHPLHIARPGRPQPRHHRVQRRLIAIQPVAIQPERDVDDAEGSPRVRTFCSVQ